MPKKTVYYKSKMLLYFSGLLLVVVTVLSAVNYATGRRMVVDNATEHASASLNQLKEANDLLLQNVVQLLQGIAFDSDLELFAKRYSSMGDYREKEAVFDRVTTVLNLNSYFTACCVYYPEQQMVIDVNARSPVYEPLSKSQSRELIEAVYPQMQEDPNTLAPLFPALRSNGSVEWVLAVPVRYSLMTDESPVLLVTLDNSCFSQNLKAMQATSGERTFIQGTDGRWLTAEPSSELQQELERQTGDGSFSSKLDGTSCLVVHTVSQLSGWQYVCVIPLEQVYQQVLFLGIFAVLAAVLCAVVGLVLVRGLAGKLYTPLEALSSKLKSVYQADELSKDALTALDVGMDALLTQNQQLQNRLSENETIVRNAFLFRLLQDGLELHESVYEQFEAYHIPFNERMRYQVAVLSTDQDESLRPTYESRRACWLKVLGFDQALKAAFATQKNFHVETVNVREDGLAIILGFEQESYTEEDMAAVCASLQKDAEDQLEAPVTLGFSALSRNVEDLPVLYQQACEALQYQFFQGGCRAISFASLPREVAEAYRYPWNLERMVLSGMRQGLIESVHRGVDEFAAYISSHLQDVAQSRTAFLHLGNDILRAAEEIAPEAGDQQTGSQLYQAILDAASSAEIVELLKQYAGSFCRTVVSQREERSGDIAQATLDYLEQHFAEPQLDMDAISSQLGFSASYISKMFKSAVGVSVKEYITQRRIALACELLRHTDKKVWEIGAEAGYEQQRSFIEIFKKYKGMTPSEYRRQKEGELS